MPDVSVVMPCLNEVETVGQCVQTIRHTLQQHHLAGEIIVCDNGSADGSAERAQQAGALVVVEPRRGYGQAYQTGLRQARGRWIVIGDSDGTYDFTQIPRFLEALQAGSEFVTGTRFAGDAVSGMPFLHRYVGNPLLTALLNYLFQTRFSDVYCGMRAFSREAYRRIAPLSPGMEFNLELAINARKAGLRCLEIPIRLHPRRTPAKLRTWRDGWRSLRFVLLYSPNSLFLVPGLGCLGLGAAAFLLAFLIPWLGWPDIWLQLEHLGSLLAIIGGQIVQCWLVAKTYSLSERFERENPFLTRLTRWCSLELGLLLGGGLLVVGTGVGVRLVSQWIHAGLAPQHSRWGHVALTLVAMGIQIVIGSFFLSLMTLQKARARDEDRAV